MLVLGRNVGETILIGDEIRVKVVKVKGGAVELGITAPREILIHREEVQRAIKEREADHGDDAGLD